MYYFIWNPTAGKGKAKCALPIIESVMKENKLPYTFLETTHSGHATELAKTAASDPKARAVSAIGGDGTIMETATGLFGHNVPLACFPMGNGNDFVHNIVNLHKFKSVEEKLRKCLEILIAGNCKEIDLIKVNDGIALNIANFGLDANVADYASKIKHVFGSVSYVIAAIKNIFTFKQLSAIVTVDGIKKAGVFTLIAVCNGKQYGGRFKIAPYARVDDGKLTLCIVEKVSILKMLTVFPSVLAGKHTHLKEFNFIDCERVDIEYEGITKMCIDGNVIDCKAPISFTVMPSAMKVIAEACSEQIRQPDTSKLSV
jgi:YegS/Rv2252/BmrU family lipid kinase